MKKLLLALALMASFLQADTNYSWIRGNYVETYPTADTSLSLALLCQIKSELESK